MHAGTVVTEQRLRHECDRLTGRPRGVLDDVLEEHDIVGGVQQRVELVVDLGLAAGADFVVPALDLEAAPDQVCGHVFTQIRLVVVRRDREVATLHPRLVAEVSAGLDPPGVPVAFLGVDLVERAIHLRVVADVVEDVELGLGAEETRVGEASGGQVLLRLTGDVARVARIRLQRERIVHEEVAGQRLAAAERVNPCGGDVREQRHIRLVDRLETLDRGAVECHSRGQ